MLSISSPNATSRPNVHNLRIGVTLALVGAIAWSTAPASAGGLLGGVGGIAASATSSVGGAVGLSGAGAPLGGLGGGIAGSGSGMLGATLTGNGLQSGFGSAVTRPLASAGGSVSGGRAWGTFEDAKGSLSAKAALVKDRTKSFTSQGQHSTNALVSRSVGKARSAAGGAKGSEMTSLTEGIVLSRSFQLPEFTRARGKAQASAQGETSLAGAASTRRAKVAGHANGSAVIKAGR